MTVERALQIAVEIEESAPAAKETAGQTPHPAQAVA